MFRSTKSRLVLVSLVPALLLFAGMAFYAFHLFSAQQLSLWRQDARALALAVLPQIVEEGRVRLVLPENMSEADRERRQRVDAFLEDCVAQRGPHLTHLAVISWVDCKPVYRSRGGDGSGLLILGQETLLEVRARRGPDPLYLADSSCFLVPLRGPEDAQLQAFLEVGIDPAYRDQLAGALLRHALPALAGILGVTLLLALMLFRATHGNALDPFLGVLAKTQAGHSDKRVDLSRCTPDLVPLGASLNQLLDSQLEQYQRLLEMESKEEHLAHRLKLFREETGDRLRGIEKEREGLELRWQTLRDAAPAGVAVLDLRTRQMAEQNARARRMLRIEEEEGASRAPSDLVKGVEKALSGGAETAEALLEIFDPILRQMRPVRVKMRRLDAHRHPASERVLLVLEDQEPLLKFERVKSEFYDHLKRNFRQPLVRMAELLAQVRSESFDPAALGELVEHATVLEREIQRLLDLEPTTPAQPRKTMIELDVAGLVAHSVHRLADRHPERHCRLQNRLSPGGGHVLADPDDLSNLFSSLFELVLEWRVDLHLEVELCAKDESLWIRVAGTPSARSNSLFDIKPAGSVEGAEQDGLARQAWMMRLQVLMTRLESYGGTLTQRLAPQRNRLEVDVSLPRLPQADPSLPQDMVGRLVRSFLQG